MSLAAQTTPLITALEQLGPHDHFCSIYESPEEHYAVAIPFIRIGLNRGEKCIYIADDGTVDDVREAMQSGGIDVDRAISSNALVLATKEQAYLEHGAFHPDWMSTFWKEATQLAMSEGFSALRATGETEWVQKWLLRECGALERWMEYESRLAHTVAENNCSALCQYNRRLFPPELILDVIRTHPIVVNGGTVCRNPYYVPPDEFLGTNQTAREVERLLTNIRERELVEDALREQLTERKRAEEELREQARLLDLTHDSVFSRSMDDKITYWNRGAEELYGWNREEAVGHVCHQLTQTIFPAPLAEINAELLHTGRWEGELAHTKRDGTQVVVASRWSLQRDERGQPVAILETNNDITESKRAEEALRRSERYLAEAQRLSHTGSWALSANSKIAAYWSEEDFRIWGFDPQQGLPDLERVFKQIHPKDAGRVYEKSMKALRERTDYTDEFRIMLPDREIRHIHTLAHPVLSANGEIAEYVGTHVDVTERKRAEAELRESERRYRYIFESTGVSIWEEDFSQVKIAIDDLKASGVQDFRRYVEEHPQFVEQAISMVTILDINEATVELFGAHDKHELLSSLDKVFTPETREVFAGELIALAEGSTWFQSQASLKTLKGDRLSVVFTITFPTESDKLNSVLVSIMDTTEQKRAEEALHKAQAELAHVTRVMTMGELTSSIAHEVNQPLAAIVTNGNACLRWLAIEPPNLDEARESVGRIIRDGHRASEVVERIRALVKKSPPRKDWLDLNEIILDVIALARNEMQRQRVSLKTQLSDDLPPVLGDRIQLQQVVLNLVMNSIEALSGVVDKTRELLVSTGRHESNGALVAVRDSGIGLDSEALDYLFNAFFTTKPDGMGMGLAISRSIIEAHGGRLWATPNELQGASFQFTLMADGESV
jgi:PAS domain S-box-containing protein